MTGDPADLDPRQLWQNQPTEHDPMTLAAIQDRARAFETKVKRRNTIEYVAAAVVTLGFLPAVLHRGSWMMQLGGALIIVATAFVVWQLHRRASARRVPDAGEAAVDFYRAELVRQRDALRSVGAWYIAPFLPGMGLLLLGRWFQSHAANRPVATDHLIILMVAAIAALVMLTIWLLNLRGADRLQKRIDEL